MFEQYIKLSEKYKKYDIYDFIICCFLATGFVFYEERTTYLDNAYLLFNILDTGTFRIEHSRFTAILPQIPAVLGVKTGFSIPIIATLLSFGYLVLHFMVYWIIKHRLGQKVLAIIYLCCLLLAMHENYFDMVTETKLALGCAVLYAALLLTDKLNNEKKLLFTIPILILGIFSHPVFILYFMVINLIYWVFRKHVYWQHFIAIGLLYFAKSAFFGSSSYEANYYEKIADLSQFSSSFLHTYMGGHIGKYYKLILILIYLISTYLYSKNLRKELGIYLASIGGIYFLLSIINASGDSHMMIQKTLYILTFVSLFPLVFIFEKLTNKLFLKVIIPLVLFASFYSIDDASTKYTNRIERLSSQIESLSKTGHKLVIRNSQINDATMLGAWALPYETAILSKWKFDKSLTICIAKEKDLSGLKGFQHVFTPPESIAKMNELYFDFSESETYQYIDSTFRLD